MQGLLNQQFDWRWWVVIGLAFISIYVYGSWRNYKLHGTGRKLERKQIVFITLVLVGFCVLVVFEITMNK